MNIEIDFLKFKSSLRLTESDGKTYVFDPIRKKEIVLTPEELLRQLVLQHILEEKKYPAGRVRVEMGIRVNNLMKRCDIVVFDQKLQPWFLIECKSPKIKLSQTVFEQSARYNLTLNVPFLAVTNGLSTFCCALDYEKKGFDFLAAFPDLG